MILTPPPRKPSTFWLAVLLAAIAVGCGSAFLLERIVSSMQAEMLSVNAATRKAEAGLRQLRDDAALAQKLAAEVVEWREEAARYLEAADEKRALAGLKKLAAAAWLSDVSYDLSQWKPEPDGLASATLTVRAAAPHDERIYGFAERLRRSLGGRAEISELKIDRVATAPDADLSAANLRMTLKIYWLANPPSADPAKPRSAAATAAPPQSFAYSRLPKSAFFSPAEVEEINSVSGRNAKDGERPLRLDAVMYANPREWTAWIGGRRVTPANEHPDFRILGASPDSVRLSLSPLPGDATITATLRLRETLDPLTGKAAP